MSVHVYRASSIKKFIILYFISIHLYCRAVHNTRCRLYNILLCLKPIYLLSSLEHFKSTVRKCLQRIFSYLIYNCALIPICFLDEQNTSKERLRMACAKLRKTLFIKPICAEHVFVK